MSNNLHRFHNYLKSASQMIIIVATSFEPIQRTPCDQDNDRMGEPLWNNSYTLARGTQYDHTIKNWVSAFDILLIVGQISSDVIAISRMNKKCSFGPIYALQNNNLGMHHL